MALTPLVGLVVLFSVMAAIGLPEQEPDCNSQVTSYMRSPDALSHHALPLHVAVARDEACVLTGIGGSSWKVQCVHLIDEQSKIGRAHV